ncbi:MAG: hypothetical protein R2854_17645 [Caldilineaceae bacterium]
MLKTEVRSGAYYDSVILMQLQRGLAALPGIDDAGVVMGTPANKDVLAQSGLLTPAAQDAGADDLIIVVGGEDDATVAAALGQVDEVAGPAARRQCGGRLPAQEPGRGRQSVARRGLGAHLRAGALCRGRGRRSPAPGQARLSLQRQRHGLDDEVRLKQTAAAQGLLVMGPDCGTAIVNGVGLGFANGVRSGNIGLVGVPGTGLQHVTARIHQLGGGITHALGTGGRDLTADVGATTARQALDLLSRDPATDVIVLISKPPAPAVARTLLDAARSAGKPVIVNFIGYVPDAAMTTDDDDNLHFVRTLDGAAALAVLLAQAGRLVPEDATEETAATSVAPLQGYLRGSIPAAPWPTKRC